MFTGLSPATEMKTTVMEFPIVYVLYGTDEFAIQQKIKEFIKEMGEPATAEMNITRLDGRNLNLDNLNNSASAIPFLSDRRLVILTNPYVGFKGAKELKKLLLLIESLPSTTTLVLAEYLDAPAGKNKSLTNWLQKITSPSGAGVRIFPTELNNPNLRDIPDWIIAETKRQSSGINYKIGMERSASSKLAEMVGENTRIASQEISKLLEFVNYERNITVKDVEQVCIVTSQPDVFALVDALGNKDVRKAQHILLRLLQTEDPFSLWGMVVRQFRLLLLTREVLDSGGGQDVVVRDLHLHPYVAGKLVGQARHFDLGGLERIFKRMLDLDEGIKTSQMTIDLALELLVMDLSV